MDQTTAGNCPDKSVITRTWTVSDSCANSITCVQTITIQDTTKPVLTLCAKDTTINCTPIDTLTLESTNCKRIIAVMRFYYHMWCGCGGQLSWQSVITGTWTISDGCANCFMYRRHDPGYDQPIIKCPDTIKLAKIATGRVPHDSLAAFIIAGGTASDNCCLDSMSLNYFPIQVFYKCSIFNNPHIFCCWLLW